LVNNYFFSFEFLALCWHSHDQDTYALCRVFKKNAICTEVDGLQAQCSMALLEGACQQLLTSGSQEYQTPSPDVPVGSTSGGADDDADKDESWMQFISDDAWCSSTADGAEESTSCVALAT
jgi:hypothetical protein